jgi:predicted permease
MESYMQIRNDVRSFLKDLRYGARVLISSPGPTFVAVLTMALGIGVTTTVFGWIDMLLLHPFPAVSHSEELVSLETVGPNGDPMTTSYRDYRDYRDHLARVSGTAACLLNAFNIGNDDRPRRKWGEFVSGNYFDVLGVRAELGRTFLPEEKDDRPGAHPVVLVSYPYWQKELRGDPGVVGKTIRVNRHEMTLIGVAQRGFHGTIQGLQMDLWIPMVMAPELNGQGQWLLDERSERQMWVTARLKPGASIAEAGSEAKALAAEMSRSNPRTNEGFSADVMPMWKSHFAAHTLLLNPLRIIMAVAVVLFLIVVANIASLQLARATVRSKEFGIRLALGARATRVFQQLVAETLLLSAGGAACGILIALWMGRALVWLLPPLDLPVVMDIDPNFRVLGFMALISVATAVVTGLAPAAHALRCNLNETLRQSGRSSTAGKSSHRTRSALVVVEVALATVALAGTGLFAKSFQNALALDPRLDANDVVFAQLYVATFCRTPEERIQFAARLKQRLEQAPRVSRVSYSNAVPLELGSAPWTYIQVEGYVPAPGEDMRVASASVSPGFFETLRIPLLQGRDFRDTDEAKAESVAVVNQTFAARYFGGTNPVGRKVKTARKWTTIIGLAKDSKYGKLDEPARPYLYRTSRQASGGEFWFAFFIRTTAPVRDMIAPLRREVIAVDPQAGVAELVPFAEHITASLYQQKVAAILLSVLGAISLLIAAVGLYSVMAYAVAQRSSEIGIRMALGAVQSDVLGMMVSQGMKLTAIGLLAGLVAAVAASRLAVGMLVGVSPTDPVVLAAAGAFLTGVAAAASYLPARRATKVDPVTALRL